MDEADKRILGGLQRGIPAARRPFLGLDPDLSEGEVVARLRRLKRDGVIRRFGAVIDYRRLGFKSTLVALRVPEDRLVEVAEEINRIKGVTHNYQRDFEYNLWFTLIEPSMEELNSRLRWIEEEIKPEKMLDLPVVKQFKIGPVVKWTA